MLRRRVPTPHGYPETLEAIAALVRDCETSLGVTATVGIGIPGVVSPATGLVKNANSIALNGHRFDHDISHRPVAERCGSRTMPTASRSARRRTAPAAGFGVVFGVILGTGCGGGIVMHGTVHQGPHRVAGEWGHTPLPWPSGIEVPGNLCWCGKHGCLETYVAGPSLAHDCDGPGAHDASRIPDRAAAGDRAAIAALDRHADRLARGLAVVINLLDPDVIVLGGGVEHGPPLHRVAATYPALCVQ